MCGDGLTDLVRIRNGEVCYWPNIGYGRFGAKVSLDNSPHFDTRDLYDPRRIRLADIDGSGPVDLIYLGRDGARLYFNRSGNSLSDAQGRLPVATENLARCRWPTCSATAPPAWCGTRTCRPMRASQCATST